MSTKTKVLNVHADSPDLRDRIYNPALLYLGKSHNPRPFAAQPGRQCPVDPTPHCASFHPSYFCLHPFFSSRGTPILRMETFFEKRPSPTGQALAWDWIAAPTISPDTTRRSNSTSHGGFDDDQDTRLAVIERIARRQGSGTSFKNHKRR